VIGLIKSVWAWVVGVVTIAGLVIWKLWRRAVTQRDEARRQLEQEQAIAEKREKIQSRQKKTREEGQARVEEARAEAKKPEARRGHFEDQ